ncbi:RING-H2 finger protein atl80, partial [Phtheirospermum japonicum]
CICSLSHRRHCRSAASAARASTESSPPAAANKGLKKKVLKLLPKQTVGEDEMAEKLSGCAICLAEFAAGDKIRVLPQCGHSSHVGCIDT